MIKKSIATMLLSLAVSTAYADAPVMIDVTGDMSFQSFNVDKKQWAYQFTNKTSKTLRFLVTVSPDSQGAVIVQCFHKGQVEDKPVYPGRTSEPCITDDVIRLVTGSSDFTPAVGVYNISVISN